MNLKAGVMYQFLVLIILSLFNVATLYLTGNLHDMITGAIIVTMVGIPFSDSKQISKQK